jgi:hypothetical protein
VFVWSSPARSVLVHAIDAAAANVMRISRALGVGALAPFAP